MRHLPGRVDAGVGAPRDDEPRVAAEDPGEGVLERALHGAQPGLARPAAEVRAVIGDIEPDAHGPSLLPAARAARRGPRRRPRCAEHAVRRAGRVVDETCPEPRVRRRRSARPSAEDAAAERQLLADRVQRDAAPAARGSRSRARSRARRRGALARCRRAPAIGRTTTSTSLVATAREMVCVRESAVMPTASSLPSCATCTKPSSSVGMPSTTVPLRMKRVSTGTVPGRSSDSPAQ